MAVNSSLLKPLANSSKQVIYDRPVSVRNRHTAMCEQDSLKRVLIAAREGDLSTLSSMKPVLEKSLIIQDNYGATCVHYAARNGNIQILQFLIETCKMPSNIRSDMGSTPCHDAAVLGKLSALIWLLKNTECSVNDKDHEGATVLHVASRYGRKNVVRWLLKEAKASPLDKTHVGALALHYAAAKGYIDCVKLLLEASPELSANSPMDNNLTPVYLAAEKGHIEVLKYLILSGKGSLQMKAKNGMAPIHAATQSGALKCVKWMVEDQGIDVNDTDNHLANTVHFAASRGHFETLKWLLKHGASVTLDKYGKSPLNDAAENEHIECLALLISHISNSRYNSGPVLFNHSNFYASKLKAWPNTHKKIPLNSSKSSRSSNDSDCSYSSDVYCSSWSSDEIVLEGINSAFATNIYDQDVQICSELSDSLDNSVSNQLFSKTQSSFSSSSCICTNHVTDSDKEITNEDSLFVSSQKSYSYFGSTSSSEDVERIYKKCRAKSTHTVYDRPKKRATAAHLAKTEYHTSNQSLNAIKTESSAELEDSKLIQNVADNSVKVFEANSKSSKEVVYHEFDNKSETTNTLVTLEENKVNEKVTKETIITLPTQKASTCKTEPSIPEPKDEKVLTANTPPPPPPPPPSLVPQQNLGNTKNESIDSESNISKDVNEKVKNKTFKNKPLQAFFIPPKFNAPSENDINIKPSEYLKKFGNKSSAPKYDINKVKIEKSSLETHLNSDISHKQEEIRTSDQLVNEYVEKSSDHKKNRPDQNEKSECQISLLKVGQSLLKPITTRQKGFSVTDEDLKRVHLKKTVKSKEGTILVIQNNQVTKEEKVEEEAEIKVQDSVSPVKKVELENVIKKVSADEYKPENFLEQIKSTYSSGAPIPEWKRLILAKKAAEKAKKEAKLEEASIPDWKKQLMNKKEICSQHLQSVKMSSELDKSEDSRAKLISKNDQPLPTKEEPVIINKIKKDEQATANNWLNHLRKTNSVYW